MNLAQLSASQNLLTDLPANFEDLGKLEILELDDNKLERLPLRLG